VTPGVLQAPAAWAKARLRDEILHTVCNISGDGPFTAGLLPLNFLEAAVAAGDLDRPHVAAVDIVRDQFKLESLFISFEIVTHEDLHFGPPQQLAGTSPLVSLDDRIVGRIVGREPRRRWSPLRSRVKASAGWKSR